MECPYCGTELICEDSYGNHDYICHGDIIGKRGDIYSCPNHEGFKTREEALVYIEITDSELETYLAENSYEDWEEISCDSAVHNVSGSFYTDLSGCLYEGYPC